MVYLYNRILFGHKKEWRLKHQWTLKTSCPVKEASHKRPHIIFHFHEMFRTDKSIQIESRLWLSRVGRMEWKGVTANGYWVSFCSNESALKLIMVIVAQLCEYAEKYRTVKFNWVNCMLCTFYLNKVVF